MKIARVKEPDNGNNQPRRIRIGYSNQRTLREDEAVAKACFKVFDSDTELKKMMKKENIWCYYEFDSKIDDETKMRYESFFSGFLYYYDTELRNGLIDHTLLCHWDSKRGKDSVTVFIDPIPIRKLANSEKTAKEYLNDAIKQQDAISDAVNQWQPPTVSGLQSDPPSPTGPPPPAP